MCGSEMATATRTASYSSEKKIIFAKYRGEKIYCRFRNARDTQQQQQQQQKWHNDFIGQEVLFFIIRCHFCFMQFDTEFGAGFHACCHNARAKQ